LHAEPVAPGTSRFYDSGQHVFDVVERAERRFLGSNEIARFVSSMPDDDHREARLEVRHTGRMRRSGVEVLARDGGEPAEEMARLLMGDEDFTAAVFPLDFTRFDVAAGEGVWTATIELMGASYISIALPPIRNYVRLYPDQRDALLATIAMWQKAMTPTR
jgi:Protein of unknown function (DUF3156)